MFQVFFVAPMMPARLRHELPEKRHGQPVDQRQSGVMFDRKKSVWHGDKNTTAHAAKLLDKRFLITSAPNVLEYGVGIRDVEFTVAKRKRFPYFDALVADAGIRRYYSATVAKAGTNDLLPVRMLLLEHIALQRDLIRDADIQNRGRRGRAHQILKKPVVRLACTTREVLKERALPGMCVVNPVALRLTHTPTELGTSATSPSEWARLRSVSPSGSIFEKRSLMQIFSHEIGSRNMVTFLPCLNERER